MEEKCAACQQPFTCGASEPSCWCSEIHLSDAASEELSRRYSGCLCESCLKKIAAEFPDRE